MGNRFASGKKAIAICDRCGFQYRLRLLRSEVVKGSSVDNRVCPACWDPDHPQRMLGMYPVEDPQALRDPRPDSTYDAAGVNTAGNPTGGSRDIQWGWNPVGGARMAGIPNYLVATTSVGAVTVA